MERSVEYVRRKAFSLSVNYSSLEEAQKHLDDVCRAMDSEAPLGDPTQKQLRISADLAAMRPWPGDIGCFEALEYAVSKWSAVCVRGNHYSVPDRLVGQSVIVKLYSDRIVIVKDKQKIATHERLAAQGGWSLKLEHYLTTLLRKPGALAGSVALQQVPHLIRKLFDSHFSDCPKDFLELLRYATDNGYCFRDVTDAAARLAARGLHSLCGDQLKAELHSTSQPDSDLTVGTSARAEIIPGQSTLIEQQAMTAISDTDYLLNIKTNTIKHAI